MLTSFISYDKFKLACLCFSPLVLKSDVILTWNLQDYIIKKEDCLNSISLKDISSTITTI